MPTLQFDRQRRRAPLAAALALAALAAFPSAAADAASVPAAPGCAAIKYGPLGETGSIDKPGERDCFVHQAEAGERWLVHVVETDGSATLLQEIRRPDGSSICGPDEATEISCLLDATGPFEVHLQDSSGGETGAYRVVLERFPRATHCAPIHVSGLLYRGGVDQPGAIDCATFHWQVGADLQMTVKAKGGDWDPVAEVLRPDGSIECGPTFEDRFLCVLKANGEHTVIVSDGDGTGASTGRYKLSMHQ